MDIIGSKQVLCCIRKMNKIVIRCQILNPFCHASRYYCAKVAPGEPSSCLRGTFELPEGTFELPQGTFELPKGNL